MKPIVIVLVMASTGLATGCRQLPTSSTSPSVASSTTVAPTAPASADLAKTAAKDFADTLRGRLQTAMATEGVVGAISFCKVEAPRIAEAIQQQHGVRLGRVPVPGRQRNPTNSGPSWVDAALSDFKRRAEAGEPVNQLTTLASSNLSKGVSVRFAKAIDVQPACLACHGKTIAAPVADALRRHYPGDTATGFDVGDLRGLLWVEVPSR